MFGGIWTLCIHLDGHEIRFLREKQSFPDVPQCVNYLAESARNSANEEMKTGWQHSESLKEYQPPHLSRYNRKNAQSCDLICSLNNF